MKVGVDGLTKKERRALKVQQNKIPVANTKNECNIQQNKETISNNNKVQQTAKNDAIIVKNDEQDTKSKAQLKAERAAKFQAERGAKLAVEKSNENGDTKQSKAELRASRRQLQEKQREAKVTLSNDKKPVTVQAKPLVTLNMKPANEQPKVIIENINVKKQELKKTETINKHQVQLFHHLYFKSRQEIDIDRNLRDCNIHPAFVRLGAQYYHKTIMGSNARCLSLLAALDMLVKDYEPPKNQEFCRSLEFSLQNSINYLQSCRPLAVSMTNALRHFKLNLTQINTNLSDNQKKAKLVDIIETYIQDEIEKAGEAISLKVQHKITNGDIILTYGW